MGLGILAGALGVSLIGGGTWAAFNDVETLDNKFASGTLDLTTSQSVLFDLDNLKPGDTFTKTLTLGNNGSLAIDDIFVTTTVSGWADKKYTKLPLSGLNGKDDGENTQEEFLSQFDVVIKRGNDVVYNGTAAGLSSLTNAEISGSGAAAAIAPAGSVTYTFEVEFDNKTQTYPSSRFQEQNKFQDEGASFSLKFEGTQMPGENRSTNN